VHQSGSGPATHGRISKQGSVRARHALVGGVLERSPPARAATRLLRAHPRPPRPPSRGRRLRAQAGLPVLVPAHARAGLGLPTALADQQEAAPPRAPSRRPPLHASGRRHLARPTTPSARPSASSPARPRRPTSAPCVTGTQPRPTRWAGARHRDAHLQAVRAASSAAGRRSQTLRFSSSSPAPPRTLARSGQRVEPTLDFPSSQAGVSGARAETPACRAEEA
jgi:hypothetical protein